MNDLCLDIAESSEAAQIAANKRFLRRSAPRPRIFRCSFSRIKLWQNIPNDVRPIRTNRCRFLTRDGKVGSYTQFIRRSVVTFYSLQTPFTHKLTTIMMYFFLIIVSSDCSLLKISFFFSFRKPLIPNQEYVPFKCRLKTMWWHFENTWGGGTPKYSTRLSEKARSIVWNRIDVLLKKKNKASTLKTCKHKA